MLCGALWHVLPGKGTARHGNTLPERKGQVSSWRKNFLTPAMVCSDSGSVFAMSDTVAFAMSTSVLSCRAAFCPVGQRLSQLGSVFAMSGSLWSWRAAFLQRRAD